MQANKLDYKRIGKLLSDLHTAYKDVKNDQVLKVNILNNEYGINKENIDSILIKLVKLKLLARKSRVVDNFAYFMKFDIRFKILDEVKHHYEFDLISYENEINKLFITSNRNNIIAAITAIVAILAFLKSFCDEDVFDKKIKPTNDRIDSLINASEKKVDTLHTKIPHHTKSR